jgi:hypothetical protein
MTETPPLDIASLAAPPVRVEMGDSHYSVESQTRIYGPGTEPLTFTGSGTQTYMANGRPFDSDND